uniref:GH26 domain-containing protein n=1 Tax=Phakopsora pachyrhizi TaxID=170000 RepID=A0A0S1MJB9_PHAPC
MAILGDYIKLDTNAEGLRNIDWHLETIQKLPGNPVYQIALMPNHGLKSLSKLVINRIAAKMEDINQKNVTVWLRFGHEMNGQWYSWGLKPNLFKKKWIHLTLAIRKRAPNTYMMWAPNARFGKSVNSVKGGYSPYWPGSQYVDIAALSYYHFGGPSRLNIVPAQNEAIEKLKEFSKLYGYRGKGKPIVLAETSAPFTRSLFGKVPERGGGSEEEIKISWLSQLFSGKMHGEVPELKAISWFEVKKNEKAPDGRYRKSEDFRLLLGKEEVSQEASSYLAGDWQAD